MSWPDMIYRPQDPNADDMGMVNFAPPLNLIDAYGVSEGLPKNWLDKKGKKDKMYREIEKVSAWDVVGGNPLYEAAAGALDIDWNEFKENFNNEIGDEDLYERPVPEAEAEAESGSESIIDMIQEDDDDEDKPYDWGITNEGIEGDLNDMQDWLAETISDAKEKRGYDGGGPSAEDWGYNESEGSIWTILGLDQPPQGPQPLADDMFDYKDSPGNYDKLEHYAGHPDTDANPWLDAGVWLGMNPDFKENREFYDAPPDIKQSHAAIAAENTTNVNARE